MSKLKALTIGNHNITSAYLGSSNIYNSLIDIAKFFVSGVTGMWLDISDLSTMFQDSAGTIPVTGDSQPVGLIVDKSGNGNNVIQPSSAKRPLYRTDGSKHWLYFDGVDDYLYNYSTKSLSTGTAMSYFTAYKTPTANTKAGVLALGTVGTNTVIRGSRLALNTGTTTFGLSRSASSLFGNISNQFSNTTTPEYSRLDNHWETVAIKASTTATELYLNSVPYTLSTFWNLTPTGSTAYPVSVWGASSSLNETINIGYASNANNYLKGNISSVLLIGSELTNEEFLEVDKYVNSTIGGA